MDLRDYPRPPGDTGIGVHWNAGFPAAIGLGQIRDIWLPELIAMGVKWVKITRHDGGLEFCELLLKHDIMPIVRLYRPRPNPGTLDEETLRMVSNYVAAGVRYFEFNNEPDLPAEWQNGFVPPDAPQIVAHNAITDMEAILERGGYPGIPALAVGTKWDLVGEICRLGRRDLLAEPVWQAIHNYSLNHPLDYPYDPGNQQGAPYTREFYDRLAQEQWGGDAWGGWSLERVNQERREHANPGATAFDDPSCWRAYERYDKLIRDQIGRSLPILSTENGYVVGERPDPRYPATTPQLHMAQTLEACRIMMGTSSRFDHAPDYYFCTAFWLLGNYTLGHWAPQWEGQAWYSARWPGGQLPIVAALKAEPKQARVWRGDAGVAGRVSGTLKGGANLPIKLQRADGWNLTTRADSQGRYEFLDVPLGTYTVALALDFAQEEETPPGQMVSLTRERPAATANFDLSGITIIIAESVLRGVVRGGAGMHLRLTRPADGWQQELIIPADGSYRFDRLPAGTYMLSLEEAQVARAGIELDGRSEAVVDLAVPGWGWEASDGGPSPGFGVVRCRVAGRSGLPVRIRATGWSGISLRTGSKPEYGPDVCEFAPLGAGTYTIQPEGLNVQAQITLDGRRVIWVTFNEITAELPQQSVIAGTITNGAGLIVRLLRAGSTEPIATVQADKEGRYSFTGLPAGFYTIQVVADGPEGRVAGQRSDIVVDGTNQAQADFALPPPSARWRWEVEDGGPGHGFSLVRCQVAGQPGRDVRLWASGWSGITQRTGSKPEYGPDVCEFAPLGPGIYFVAPQGLEAQAEVHLKQNQLAWVRFRPPTLIPEPEPVVPEPSPAEPQGPEPAPPAEAGLSTIGGAVVNGEGLQVVLSGPAGERRVSVTNGRYSFDGLPAGTYRVAVLAADPAQGEAAVREEVTVDGLHPVIVDFVIVTAPGAGSRIWGRVRGGAGRIVALEGPLPPGWHDPEAGGEVTAEVRTTTVGPDELYSFSGLPAGIYRAIVQDTDPPTGITQFQAGIELDGLNSVQVDFDLDALGPGKTIEHYLLVGSTARSREDFLAALQYVARFQPVVGTDEVAARQARHVTILGGVSAVSALVEQGLRMSGCQVQRIEADFAEKLGQLLNDDRPY